MINVTEDINKQTPAIPLQGAAGQPAPNIISDIHKSINNSAYGNGNASRLESTGILFNTFQDSPSTVGGISVGAGAPRLYPGSNGGSINVAKNFPWTLTTGPARTEVPTITLREYKLTESALIAAAAQWIYVVKGVFSDRDTNPYFGLYPAEPTYFQYILPYFSEYNKEVANTWENSNVDLSIPGTENAPFGLDKLGKLASVEGVENIAKYFAIGVGHEIPKSFTGGILETIRVNFVLLNTTFIYDVKRNWEFCYLIAYQNLQNRRNAILVDPPVFYTLSIPGVKYSNASYVSNLAITNLGQTKELIIDDKPYVIPEAYSVSISFTDLIPPSRNIMNAMKNSNDSMVVATEDTASGFKASAEKVFKERADDLGDTFGGIVGMGKGFFNPNP